LRSPPEPIAIVGMLDDGPAGLADAARARLAAADMVIGAERLLALCGGHLNPRAQTRELGSHLAEVPDWIREARTAGRRVVVLATGDPLCFGLGARLIEAMGAEAVEVLPALSTLQVACARLKRPWGDAHIVSIHGRDSGEWPADASATPQHGLAPLLRAAAHHDRILCLTSPANGPGRIARALVACGLGEQFRLSVACRLRRPDEALFPDLSPADAAARAFPEPNVVVLERVAPPPAWPLLGLYDGEYLPRPPGGEGAEVVGGLITKRDVRAISLARLGLRAGSVVWDIGAGSGSVGLEAARLARSGHVWAMEKDGARAGQARANARRFGITNYTLQEGRAPAGLESWPDPDAVFIGGSGGELPELIWPCLGRLRPGGRLVMNFATLENLAVATATLKNAGADWEACQISVAHSRPILGKHRMAAQNPVWIVTTTKEEK
jgi:precorrin-6B C5,15-methyltransferase / cobalt-precorrin-6B C5,C15-methyltransferase